MNKDFNLTSNIQNSVKHSSRLTADIDTHFVTFLALRVFDAGNSM